MRLRALVLVLLAGAVVRADDNSTLDKARRTDMANLQGTWVAKSTHGFSKDIPKEELETLTLTFSGDKIEAHYGAKSAAATYKLNPTANPAQIDVTVTKGPEAVQGQMLKGIYLLEDGTLRIEFRRPGEERPKEFVTEGQAGVIDVLLKKQAAK